jgi:hypothetical protein
MYLLSVFANTEIPINSVSLVIYREMFSVFQVPMMMFIGIFFLVASVFVGVTAVLKLVFFVVFLPLRILFWLIGLI